MSTNSEQPEELSDLSELDFTFGSSDGGRPDSADIPDIDDISFEKSSVQLSETASTEDDSDFDDPTQNLDLPDIDSMNLQGDSDSPKPVLPQPTDEATEASSSSASNKKKIRKNKRKKKKQEAEPDLDAMFSEITEKEPSTPAPLATTSPAQAATAPPTAPVAPPEQTGNNTSAAAAAMASASKPPTARTKKKSTGISLSSGVIKGTAAMLVTALIGFGLWQLDFTSFGGDAAPTTVFTEFEKAYAAATTGNNVDKTKWEAIRKDFNAQIQSLIVQYSAKSDVPSKKIIRTVRAMIKTIGMSADDFGKVDRAYKQYEREKSQMTP